MLGYVGEGDNEVAILQLSDAECRQRATMQVGPKGNAVISLVAANGSGNVGLGTSEDDDEISMGISRPLGIPVLKVHWNAADGLQVEVWDQSEPPVIHRIVLPGKTGRKS
jgi:hypothetical protein